MNSSSVYPRSSSRSRAALRHEHTAHTVPDWCSARSSCAIYVRTRNLSVRAFVYLLRAPSLRPPDVLIRCAEVMLFSWCSPPGKKMRAHFARARGCGGTANSDVLLVRLYLNLDLSRFASFGTEVMMELGERASFLPVRRHGLVRYTGKRRNRASPHRRTRYGQICALSLSIDFDRHYVFVSLWLFFVVVVIFLAFLCGLK